MNSKQFAIIMVITFIVGMVWLAADIWRNTKASVPVSDKLQATLEQVNPTFNGRILETITDETLTKNDIKVTTPVILDSGSPNEEAPSSEVISSSQPSQSNSSATASASPNITPISTAFPSSSPAASNSPVNTISQ